MVNEGNHIQFWSKFLPKIDSRKRNSIAKILFEWALPCFSDLVGDGTTEKVEQSAEGSFAVKKIEEYMEEFKDEISKCWERSQEKDNEEVYEEEDYEEYSD